MAGVSKAGSIGQPGRQPIRRLSHFGLQAGEGEPHELVAALRVEVDPRRDRDPGFRQEAPAEILAVVGQAADFGVEVKSAVGERQPVKAGLGQLAQI